MTWRKLHDSCWEVVDVGGDKTRRRRRSSGSIRDEALVAARGVNADAIESQSV